MSKSKPIDPKHLWWGANRTTWPIPTLEELERRALMLHRELAHMLNILERYERSFAESREDHGLWNEKTGRQLSFVNEWREHLITAVNDIDVVVAAARYLLPTDKQVATVRLLRDRPPVNRETIDAVRDELWRIASVAAEARRVSNGAGEHADRVTGRVGAASGLRVGVGSGSDITPSVSAADVPAGEPAERAGGEVRGNRSAKARVFEAMFRVRDQPWESDREIASAVRVAPSTLSRSKDYQVIAAQARKQHTSERLATVPDRKHERSKARANAAGK